MIVHKKKTSFKTIKKLIKSIDKTCGGFLFRDSMKKKSIKELIFKLTMPRYIISFTFFMISTLIVTKFELISIIFCCAVTSSTIGLYIAMLNYISKIDVVKDLLKWCENLYDIEEKYHKLIQTTAETKMMTIERQSTKFLKYGRIIFYANSISFTLGYAMIGLFLPENVYPKFSPPLPFYLPFKDQKTWFSFVCTTLFQTLIVIDTSTVAIFLFGLGITIFIHFLGYLDIIDSAVEKIKKDLLVQRKEVKVSTKSTKNSTLNLATLTAVNASLMMSQKDSLSFEEWIKVLNEMIVDVNSKITSGCKMYTLLSFLNELASLGALFICGLLFTVVRQQYFFAIGINIVCLLLFILCFINEKIFEKYENINKTLYDIPWYNLTPKERKLLMMLMHCDKIQGGLTAFGIHTLTFNSFGIIVKAGYTNMLVLKDLVQ